MGTPYFCAAAEEKTNKILHTLIHMSMSMSASDKNYGEDILHFCHLPGLLSPLLFLFLTLSLYHSLFLSALCFCPFHRGSFFLVAFKTYVCILYIIYEMEVCMQNFSSTYLPKNGDI